MQFKDVGGPIVGFRGICIISFHIQDKWIIDNRFVLPRFVQPT